MSDHLLTARKAIWRNQFQPNILRGGALNPNASDIAKYYQRLAKLIDKMTAETEKSITRLFRQDPATEYFEENGIAAAQDASIASQARILTNALAAKFDDLFASMARPIAENVVEEANATSSATVHTSLKELSGGLSLPTKAISAGMKEILSASISENVALIKSIPAQYHTAIQGAVMRSITTGNGLQDLVPFLQNHKNITLKRARFIARDQTRKAYANLNKGRMVNLGVEEYEWLHTAGQRYPRHEHVEMNGKIYRFDNPPIIEKKTGTRGIPGQLINCACRMRPVIRFE